MHHDTIRKTLLSNASEGYRKPIILADGLSEKLDAAVEALRRWQRLDDKFRELRKTEGERLEGFQARELSAALAGKELDESTERRKYLDAEASLMADIMAAERELDAKCRAFHYRMDADKLCAPFFTRSRLLSSPSHRREREAMVSMGT